MAIRRRTWRNVDGERVEGTWRPAFIHNGGHYFLTDLLIYADGLIDCWGLVTLEEFAGKLASGWVATEVPDGARASAHHLASWTFTEPAMSLTAEMLLGEIRDDIDKLNRRPDSTARCLAALDVFRGAPTEDNRAALREAYEAIPQHMRIFALGDQDRKDFPLRVLVAGPGNPIERWDGKTVEVTEAMHNRALDYFTEREREDARYASKVPADGPTEPVESSIRIAQVFFPNGWPRDPGVLVLRNEFAAAVDVDGVEYPTVTHAYWALAVADEQRREEIRRADAPYAAQKLGQDSDLRDGWPQARAAVMARLLRAKFSRHAELAEVLLATGSARLIYNDDSTFWGERGLTGRNWMGRLLELVRAELAADAIGLSR